MNWFFISLQWYAVLIAITWAFAPWIRLLTPAMPDKAVFVARPLALLAAVYPLWLLSSILSIPYSTAGLWMTVVIGGATGWLMTWRRRRIDAAWLRLLLIAEALSLSAFALYVAWRGYAPQIVNTEKPMDIAFLASSWRATSMPPPDPWMAGETINYYYLGFLLHGAITRMSGIVPTIGFNLALATTFSMTVTAVFGVGFVIVREWASVRRAVIGGALAVALLVIGGNLYAAGEFIANPSETVDATWWGGVGWNASRVVVDAVPGVSDTDTLTAPGAEPPVDTINEFPAFSFVLGDLHPHLLALPFTVVAVYLAFALYRFLVQSTHSSRRDTVRLALTGGVVGSLYMLNSWDFPTYLILVGVGVWFGSRHLGGRVAAIYLAILGVSSLAFWLPFFVRFTPPVGVSTANIPNWLSNVPLLSTLLTAIGAMRWEHTSIAEFITIFGVPYLLSIWFLGHGMTTPALAHRDTNGSFDQRSAGIFAATILGFGLVLAAPVVVLCGIPLTLALLQHPARRRTWGPPTILFSLGFALILGTEFFYIQDIFGNRMNTLFKIYYQAWTLFGIATAIAIVALWRDVGLGEAVARRATRPTLATVVLIALAAVTIYPVLSATAYRSIREAPGWTGLDGMAYIGEIAPGQLAAMRWIRDNATEDDVLLEALGCSYQVNSGLPTSGVSAFTGVPAVLGWPGHERQWHLGDETILQEQRRRATLFDQLYSLDGQAPRDEFGVTLIYVGPFERTGTPACDTAGPYPAVLDDRFPGPGWEVAFSEGDATIYQRDPAVTASASS